MESANKLVFSYLPQRNFDVTEALNQLRINLDFSGNNIRKIMITSSTPNEGKSFIAVNLWRSIAESGKTALLVDLDLRNSTLIKEYGIKCDKPINSIAQYLAGKTDLKDVFYETNVTNGYILPMVSYVTNPFLILDTNMLVDMLDKFKNFDYIIIDTPPIGTVADALKIVPCADGYVMVVRSGVTPKKIVLNSIELMSRSEVPFLGIVLNRANLEQKKYYRYGYSYYKKYGYYNKYDTYNKEKRK